MQKILGGPSGSIGSVGGGSDTAGSKTGATEPVTPAPVSPARIGDGPGEQRTGAQSPPVMMSPEMLKTILAESMAMGMQIASSSKMFLCTFASPSDPTSQLWSSTLPKRDEMIN